MRNRNLISMIYANLEKASAAAEQIAQTNAHSASAVGAYCCDRAAHSCAADFINKTNPRGAPPSCRGNSK
jgi:hypothetical protein